MVVSVEYSRSRPLPTGISLVVSYSPEGGSILGIDPGLNVEDSESVDPLRSEAILSSTPCQLQGI